MPKWLFVEHTPREEQWSLHVWVGPAGLHLFWPDLWKSRPDWCSRWREPPQ